MAEREPENANGQQRRRIPVACARCRKRKIKCSGDPGDGKGCQNCRSAGCEPSDCRFQRMSAIALDFTTLSNDGSRACGSEFGGMAQAVPYHASSYPDEIDNRFNNPGYARIYPPISSLPPVMAGDGMVTGYAGPGFDQPVYPNDYPMASGQDILLLQNGYLSSQSGRDAGMYDAPNFTDGAPATAAFEMNPSHSALSTKNNVNGGRVLPVPSPIHPAVQFPNNMNSSLESQHLQTTGWGPEARTSYPHKHEASSSYTSSTNNSRRASMFQTRISSPNLGSSAERHTYSPKYNNSPSSIKSQAQTITDSTYGSNRILPAMTVSSGLPVILPSTNIGNQVSEKGGARHQNVVEISNSSQNNYPGLYRQESSPNLYCFSGENHSRGASYYSSTARRQARHGSSKDTPYNRSTLISGHLYSPLTQHGYQETPSRQSLVTESSYPHDSQYGHCQQAGQSRSPTISRKQSTTKSIGSRI